MKIWLLMMGGGTVAASVCIGLYYLKAQHSAVFLIERYRKLSPSERKQYDEQALCQDRAKVCFLVAAFWAMGVVAEACMLLGLGAVIGWVGTAAVWCIYLYRTHGENFDKLYKHSGTMGDLHA